MNNLSNTIVKRWSRMLFAWLLLGVMWLGSTAGPVLADGETNLVAGLPYTVQAGVDMTHSRGKYSTVDPDCETDPALGRLTDGKRASGTDFGDRAWHKFYWGLSRTVTFELKEAKAVTGFAVSALQDNDAGLPLPSWFELSVSENGTDYMLISRYDNSDRLVRSGTNYHKIVAKDLGRVRANYVRLTFPTSCNVFLDEIEIYGSDPNGTETPFVRTEEPTYPNAFDPGVEGCRDLVLLYCGYEPSGDNDRVQNTEEEMLYYFGYVGTDGRIQDTLFDSFMFSALRGACPSGGSLNAHEKKQSVKEDWEYYLASIFDETYNCGAIERAVEKVGQATGREDLVVSMVINLPYPTIGDQPFGDIDGDGKPEYCRNRDEQFAIYRWCYDRVEEYLETRRYQHIRLGGYYWEQESLSIDPSETAMMHRVIEEAHARGTKFFWIPLLYGNEFEQAYAHGFDCAMMQPNFSFIAYAEEPCFTELVDTIRKYGMGIEIEIHWDAGTDDALLSRYYSYLNAGPALGYLTGVAHSYYQNEGPGTYYTFAKSDQEKLRRVYDDTYAFVKGTYQPHAVELRSRDLTVGAGQTTYGLVSASKGSDLETLGCYHPTILEGPAHGRLDMSSNGVYTYTADADFAGDDTFTVRMDATYASSKPITVTIHVTNSDGTASADPSGSDSADSNPVSASEPGSAGRMGWLMGGIAVAVLAAGGAAGALVWKKRKK